MEAGVKMKYWLSKMNLDVFYELFFYCNIEGKSVNFDYHFQASVGTSIENHY